MSLMDQHKHLEESINLTLQEAKNTEGLAEDILQKIIAESLRVYQHKLNVGVQDSIADLIDVFKHKIADQIFEAAETWHIPQREPFLFPPNCRFMYQLGKTTVVVMEFPPQCRTLSFSSQCLGEGMQMTSQPTRRLYLSLPYTIFIVSFKDNDFSSLHFAFRKKPLESLDDELCRSILPNIHDNLLVCTGDLEATGNITNQVSEIVNGFWSSEFNTNLMDRWENMSIIDPRLESGFAWERFSREDPMFIMGVGFSPSARTISSIITDQTAREEEPDESAFRHDLSDSIEACVDEMFKRLLKYFKKTKFERHIPKDISQDIQNVIGNVMGEVSDLVIVLQDEVNKLSSKLGQKGRQFEKKGPYWS